MRTAQYKILKKHDLSYLLGENIIICKKYKPNNCRTHDIFLLFSDYIKKIVIFNNNKNKYTSTKNVILRVQRIAL